MARKKITEAPRLTIYCQRAGMLAVLTPRGRRCTGVVEASGDGIGGADDKYGEPYDRRCACGIGGVVVRASRTMIPISGCVKTTQS